MKKLWLATAFIFCAMNAHAVMETDYYQAGSNQYYCASTTTIPVPTAAGLTAASSPLILWNPAGSGVKLVVLDVGVDITAAPAAATGLMLAYNLVTSTGVVNFTSGTVTTAMIGVSTGTLTNSKANCSVAGTLPATPTAFRFIGGTTGAAAIGGTVFNDPEFPPGKVVIPPGAIVSLQTTSATALIAHITWVEVPY